MPGCNYTFVLDLEKKSVPRACANTLGGYREVILKNDKDHTKDYNFKVLTGCRNEPRKGEVFCDSCLGEFRVDFACGEKNASFLEALYPLGNQSSSRKAHRGDTNPRKNPGPD